MNTHDAFAGLRRYAYGNPLARALPLAAQNYVQLSATATVALSVNK